MSRKPRYRVLAIRPLEEPYDNNERFAWEANVAENLNEQWDNGYRVISVIADGTIVYTLERRKP
jgi:hypothetical protein